MYKYPIVHTFPLRSPAISFALTVDTQTTKLANVPKGEDQIPEEPLFHFSVNKKLIKPPINQNRKQTRADDNKDILELNIVSSSKGSTLSFIKLNFSRNLSRKALIDTGACGNVISRRTLEDLKADKTVQIQSSNEKKEWNQVRMAGGQTVNVQSQVHITFIMAHRQFSESFLVLPTANSIILGDPFFKRHDITINPAKNFLQFDDLTVQINEIKPYNEPRRIVRQKKIPIYTVKKTTLMPNQHTMLECKLQSTVEPLHQRSGIIIPNETLERETYIALTSSLSTVGTNDNLFISAINITDHPITLPTATGVGRFSVLTTEQAEKLILIDPELISLAKQQSEDGTIP